MLNADSKLLLSLIVGLVLGVVFSNCFFSEKIYRECTTQHLTTFWDSNYMCIYVGTPEQHRAYLESKATGTGTGAYTGTGNPRLDTLLDALTH